MGSNLIHSYDWIEDVGGTDMDLIRSLDGFNVPSDCCIDFGDPCGDACSLERTSSKKSRARDDLRSQPNSKACREKLRRERLNDRFLELCSLLEPGRPPRSDRALILSCTARALVQLRDESHQLKEANEKLQKTIKDLKAEKNELRDEKTKLKAEKERLEKLVKAMSMPPAAFMPHVAAFPAAMAAQAQAASSKTASFPGFPGMAMWQWMPPAMVDTSQDHKLRPPVA